MKLFNVLALFSAMAFVGSTAFAAAPSAYDSTKHSPGRSVPQGANGPATVLTIVDNANEEVHVIIPGSPIDDALFPGRPGNVDNIWNQEYGGNTEVQLVDANGNVFFDQYVWNHAVMNIHYGANGELTVDQISR